MYAVRLMLESAEPLAVPGDIRSALDSNRQRGRAPGPAAVIVADVQRFAGPIADRVVRPRRDLVLAAVQAPGAAGTRLRNQKTELLVGDDVYPRGGCRLALAQHRDVFSAVLGESSETVEKVELGSRQAGGSGVGPGRARRRRRRGCSGLPSTRDLLRKATVLAHQDDARGPVQKIQFLGRQVRGVEDEETAPPWVVERRRGLTDLHHALEQRLQVLGIGGPFLVQEHNVHGQALAAPVLVCAQQLAHDLAIIRIVDPAQHDRIVTGDAVTPQLADAAGGAPDRLAGSSERSVEVEQSVGKVLKQVCLVRPDAKVVPLHQRVGPCEHRDPSECRGIMIFVRQAHDLLARARRHGREREVNGGSRRHAHPRAQAENRVEHGSDRVRQRPSIHD